MTYASDNLAEIRGSIRVTQAAMAAAMGMPIRTYEDLEAGRSTTRPVHILAAKSAAMHLVIDGKANASLLPRDIRELAHGVSHLCEEVGV